MRVNIFVLALLIAGCLGLAALALRGRSSPKDPAIDASMAAAPVPEHPNFLGAIPAPATDLATGQPVEDPPFKAPPLLSVEEDVLPAIAKLKAARAAPPSPASTETADAAFNSALADFRNRLAAGDDMGTRTALEHMLDMSGEVSQVMLGVLENDLELLRRSGGTVPR